jgi:hypothetical protein
MMDRGETNADAERKGAGIAHPAVLDLKQEADLDVHPFAFKPLQVMCLVDPKTRSSKALAALVHYFMAWALGTHPTLGLSAETGRRLLILRHQIQLRCHRQRSVKVGHHDYIPCRRASGLAEHRQPWKWL